MTTSVQSTKRSVLVVEATAFESKAVAPLLPAPEKRALILYLAENPTVGKPVPGQPGLLSILFFGCDIFFVLHKNIRTIFLLDIEKAGGNPPPPTTQEKSQLRKVLKRLIVTGVIVEAKTGIKWLWDLLIS